MLRFTIIALILSILILPGLSTAAEVAEESMVGYWAFDEGTGKKATDLSAEGNDGEFVGSPKWVDGIFGKALEFDGNGNYVSVPDANSLDLTDKATFMAWFSPTDPLTHTRMMVKNDSIFVIFDWEDDDTIDFLVKPNNDFVESQSKDWQVGQWYHFAASYDGDTLRIYVNGEMEAEKDGIPHIAPSNLDLWIGADDWDGAAHSTAIIDEVRLYNKALTDAEIKQAMEGPAAVAPLGKLAVTWGGLKR